MDIGGVRPAGGAVVNWPDEQILMEHREDLEKIFLEICRNTERTDIRQFEKHRLPLMSRTFFGAFMETTSPHYGGVRYWWKCPVCGSRCAVLFWGACRICSGYRYPTETMTPNQRDTAKAFKLRKRLGETKNVIVGRRPPPKPKYMHQKTYDRLISELEKLQASIFDNLPAWLKPRDPDPEVMETLERLQEEREARGSQTLANGEEDLREPEGRGRMHPLDAYVAKRAT